jgi:hypothetical protein
VQRYDTCIVCMRVRIELHESVHERRLPWPQQRMCVSVRLQRLCPSITSRMKYAVFDRSLRRRVCAYAESKARPCTALSAYTTVTNASKPCLHILIT